MTIIDTLGKMSVEAIRRRPHFFLAFASMEFAYYIK